jgi:hypothetical protein
MERFHQGFAWLPEHLHGEGHHKVPSPAHGRVPGTLLHSSWLQSLHPSRHRPSINGTASVDDGGPRRRPHC